MVESALSASYISMKAWVNSAVPHQYWVMRTWKCVLGVWCTSGGSALSCLYSVCVCVCVCVCVYSTCLVQSLFSQLSLHPFSPSSRVTQTFKCFCISYLFSGQIVWTSWPSVETGSVSMKDKLQRESVASCRLSMTLSAAFLSTDTSVSHDR